MKKFILFTVVLYVLFLLSFKEDSPEPESFAKILKDHPERMKELMKVADSYRDTGKGPNQFLNDQDTLNKKELNIFRNKKNSKPSPVIVISSQALNLLIKDHLNDDDSVVFYLGQYYKNDPERIKRYNERNSMPFTNGKHTYTFKDLEKKPAFAMQVFSNAYTETEKPKNISGIFNPKSIIGSPGEGNIEFEKNNNGTNNVMVAKKAVSPIYEISRLCPPPREGCFD